MVPPLRLAFVGDTDFVDSSASAVQHASAQAMYEKLVVDFTEDVTHFEKHLAGINVGGGVNALSPLFFIARLLHVPLLMNSQRSCGACLRQCLLCVVSTLAQLALIIQSCCGTVLFESDLRLLLKEALGASQATTVAKM